MTWHQKYNQQFIANPGQNDATAYGVKVERVSGAKWRVIGIHHLTGEENHGQSNIFFEALDKSGNRVKDPYPWLGWTWEGRKPNEPANPAHLDKPDSEPAGNINLGFYQTATIWMIGQNRDESDFSDRVTGLHTRHGGTPPGNYNGHHSFYVVFQEEGEGQPDPPTDPDPPTEPEPPTPPAEDWRKMFDDRQLKEIDYCLLYDSEGFRHGTDGHNIRLIVAKFARWADGKA